MVVQALWMVAAVTFVHATQVASTLPAPAGAGVRVGVAMAGLLVAAASIYVFPLMVGYHVSVGRLLRLSALFAIGRPGTTVRSLSVVIVAGALSYLFPAAPLLLTAVVASKLYGWCEPAITTAVTPRVPDGRLSRAGAVVS